jgi:hypothetical protein
MPRSVVDLMVKEPSKPERNQGPQSSWTEEEDVDPEKAKQWLEVNKVNRRYRDPLANRYARDMAEGRWVFTGHTIKFNINGELIDGQHTLRAVIKSGVTIRQNVTRGLPLGAASCIDLGASRTLSDQLTILGYSNPSILSPGARLAFLWAHKRLSLRVETVSGPEVQEFLRENPELADAAQFASTVRCVILPGVVCAATWRFIHLGHYQSLVHEFFRDLATMRTDGNGDPKLALLRRLTRAREFRERLKTPQFLYGVVRAFNDCYLEKELHRMQLPSGRAAGNIPSIILPGGEVWEE